MSTTVFLLIALMILAGVTLLVILDGPKRKRRDDRDAAKTVDIGKNPALLYKSQQPAELQVGEDEEAEQPARFAPDTKANATYPKDQLQA
jgi:hypothetical protein